MLRVEIRIKGRIAEHWSVWFDGQTVTPAEQGETLLCGDGWIRGLGLLFQGSMLFAALIVFLLLQPVLTAASFAVVDVAVIFGMGLICFIPFAIFVRGAAAKP